MSEQAGQPRLPGAAVALAVCSVLAAPVLVQAQTKETPVLLLASVEIVGAAPVPGLGIERRLLPYPLQTVGSGALGDAHSGNLSDFMARSLTGVNVNEISGSPFQNDITYRGFRVSPVLGAAQGISVYLDGVRVNEPFGDVVNWDMIPEAAIGNVLLVPGSNPLYGLNTLGGALALSSKSGLSHPGREIDVSIGAKGRKRADVAVGQRGANGWHSFVAATLFGENGWREHSSGELGNLFAKLGASAGDTDWTVSLLGGRSRLRGNGLLPSYRFSEDGGDSGNGSNGSNGSNGNGGNNGDSGNGGGQAGRQLGGLYEDNRRASYTFPDETRNRLTQATFKLVHKFDAATELAMTTYARGSRRDTVNGDISEAYDDYVEDCAEGFRASGAARRPRSCAYTRHEGAALHPAILNTTSTRQRSQGASLNLSLRRGPHRIDTGATFDRSGVAFAQFTQEADFDAQRGVIAAADVIAMAGDTSNDTTVAREASTSVTGRARAASVYGADTWTVFAGTHITASARFNDAIVVNTLTGERGPQPRERFSYQKLNPALGVVRELSPAAAVFANIAQSNRVPTVIELGCADPEHPCQLPVGLQSDPFLKQVVSRTIEAGARWQERDTRLGASLYRTVNRDDILFLSSGATRLGYFSNVGRTRHQGLDLDAALRFIRISYSYLEAVYDSDGTLFTGARTVQVRRGTRIAGLPRHTLKLAADWKATPALTLGADVQAVSNLVTQGNEDGLRADPEDGEAPAHADWRIRGHALLHLRLSWKGPTGWEAYARVSNALNRRYETFGAIAPDLFPNGRLLKPHEGEVEVASARFVAPGAPRAVIAGLRYRF